MDNINIQVIADNRKPISMIGSTLGTQFFKAEARASIPEFDKKKMNIEQDGNKEIFFNRTPRRFRMTGHEITSVALRTDAAGSTKVVLNDDSDDKVSVPVAHGMEKIGKVSDDALGKALRGDQNIIFSDPQKLASELNVLNEDEKNRCIAAINMLQSAVKQLDSAIAENKKKANDYMNQLIGSAPSEDINENGVVLHVKKNDLNILD